MDHGHEAVIFNYSTNEPYKKNYFIQTACQHNLELKDNNQKTYSYAINNILIYEELLPFNQSDLLANQKYIFESMNRKISENQINYLITVEDDLLSLLPGLVLGIPGAHFFHSPAYLSSYQQSPFFLKLLKKRHIFAVSLFLQAKIKKELGLDSDLWHPIFDLEKYRQKKRCSHNNNAGYYSAGWHKGDDIVNRLIIEIPDWNFTVIGQCFNHNFKKIPKNLKIWGENSDFKRFYNTIGLLLVPSLTEEGFPRVILEAAANGIPAVANSMGGIPEALGDSGILVKLNTTELEHLDIKKLTASYRESIESINADKRLYRELKQKAIKRARSYEAKQAELSIQNLNRMFGI